MEHERPTDDANRMASPGTAQETDDGASQVCAMAKSAREGFEQASEYITDTVAKTQETVNRYREGGIDELKKDVVEFTREQPMTALLVAAGAGLVLGILMAVRREE